MSSRATARRPARQGRTAPVARTPRRVSGPVRRPHVPVTVPATAPALPARIGTGVFDRIRALPDARLLDRLIRSQAWIWLIGLGLGGIVFMQVWMLKLNSGISRAVESSATLERQNADLEAEIAKLSSGERIQELALRRGMLAPDAGTVKYLRVRPGTDAERALVRMTAPSEAAQQLMASRGVLPGALPPAPAQAAAPVTAPAPAAATTTTTTATAPAPAPTAAPVQPTQPTQPTQQAPPPTQQTQAQTGGTTATTAAPGGQG